MSCTVGPATNVDANTTIVQVQHCSGDVLVVMMAAGRYQEPQQRAATYLRLCYVHENGCAFKTFSV
jgi:hypothetical protein